jgi:hypothetical protein
MNAELPLTNPGGSSYTQRGGLVFIEGGDPLNLNSGCGWNGMPMQCYAANFWNANDLGNWGSSSEVKGATTI